MAISYKRLFKLLIDRNIKKGELQHKANISSSIMSRLGRNMTVRTDTIERICLVLECQPNDIMEVLPDEPNPFKSGQNYVNNIEDEEFKEMSKNPIKAAGTMFSDGAEILGNKKIKNKH